jgi:hypothetical protein
MPTPSPVLARSPDHGLSGTERVRSAPDRAPSSEERLALRLSDDQLTEVMRLCQPLVPPCRDALLRILAHELRGRRDVGDGELHRLARSIIADNHLFDAPDLDGGRMPRTSKWER